jgi:hypothetical protein
MLSLDGAIGLCQSTRVLVYTNVDHRVQFQESNSMTSSNSRIVGLDIGGSKTHAVADDLAGTAPQQEVLTGGANIS